MNLLSRFSHGFAGSGSVLDEKARRRIVRLQSLSDSLADALGRVGSVAGARRARVKADSADTERARSLQFLGETRTGSGPLVVFRRRHTQHVRGVHDDVRGLDLVLAS